LQSNNHGVKGNKKIAHPPPDSNSPPPIDNFFSSQNRNMDYVTLSGISERTGIGKNDLPKFDLKELLDNGVDVIEGQGPVSKKETTDSDKITVTFDVNSSEGQQHYLILKVRNSVRNNNNQSSFNKEKLEQIFNFSKYHSTKRNLFTVSRGALGDAFKEILACTYVLARDIGREDWNEPLIITTPRARYEIRLEADRINQTVSSIVSEFSIDNGIYKSDGDGEETRTNFTEIEVHFPLNSRTKALEYVNELHAYLMEYTLINLHISFEIKIDSPDIAKVLKVPQSLYLPSQYEGGGGNVTSNTSIYYYTYSEFQNFIEGLTVDNNSLLAYDLLRLKFREGKTLRKTALFSSLTIANLKSNQHDEIRTVYNALKEAMGPPVVDTNVSKKKLLSLPFDMSKGARKEAFRNRIQSYGIDVEGIKYDYVIGYYSSSDEERFPFIFEIAVVQSTKRLKEQLWFIESINSSLPVSENFIFSSNQNIFTWYVRGSEKVNKESGVYWILKKYGYSYKEQECKKPYNIVIVNLISPKITYKDYSKSRINLEPFARDIAETVYRVAAFSSQSEKKGEANNKLSKIDLERKLLYDRYEQIKLNPEKKITDS
jgi:hypothetical protein